MYASHRSYVIQAALISAVLLTLGCAPSKDTPTQVYERFDAAWKGSEMEKLDGCVSNSTLGYFGGIQAWVIRGDAESLRRLSAFDRYMVLMIRMQLDFLEREDWLDWNRVLESGDGSKALSGYLLELLEEELFETSLGSVDSINGTTAGRLFRAGVPIGISLHFVEENGWKIELSRFFRARFEQRLKPYLSDQYKNRDLVWELLKDQYGDRAHRGLYRSRIAKES